MRAQLVEPAVPKDIHGQAGLLEVWKGTTGVSTNGVTANFMIFFFDRGTFWVLPLTYFLKFPKVPGRTFSLHI